jgi:hypothetical protein
MAQRAQMYIKVFKHSINTSLLKSSSPGVGWGDNNGNFISFKQLKSPQNKLYICLFLVSRNIRWHVGHDHMGMVPSPLSRKCPNIYKKKTVEIPTPKPYIFFFLVSSNRWWFASHEGTWWFCPPLNRKCLNRSFGWDRINQGPVSQ